MTSSHCHYSSNVLQPGGHDYERMSSGPDSCHLDLKDLVNQYYIWLKINFLVFTPIMAEFPLIQDLH